MNNFLKNSMIGLLTVFTIVFYTNLLNAQDENTQESPVVQENPATNPRTFAFGITTLKEHGFGVKGRMRLNHFAVDGAVGSLPVIVIYQYQSASGTTTDIDAAMSLHGDLGIVGFINSDQSRFQNGIRLAGVYDSILGPGAMFGWTGELTFNTFALCFGAGIQYYPDFVKNVNKEFPATRRAELDSSDKYQLYLGINFMWYLF